MQTESVSWSDLYGESELQTVELDEAGKVLIDLLPEDQRAEKEPMLRGMLAMMRVQLGERDYVVFCQDMKRAYEMHTQGNRQDAAKLFGAYGIPYDILIAYTEQTEPYIRENFEPI